jgi:hypothetical protein
MERRTKPQVSKKISVGWGTVLAMAVRRTSLAPATVGLAGGAGIAAAVLRRRG